MFYNITMETKLYKKYEIDEIVNALSKGDIIAFPTDTVFGLGCVSDNLESINKIKKAKGRDENKPLPMMCSNIEMIAKVAMVNDKALKILKKYTPGAITVILNKLDSVPSYVTNGFKTIGIRIPNDPMILEIINKLNKPLLVTSANISNTPSLKYYRDVYKELNEKIDGLVMENALSETASTIIDLTSEEIKILRQGIITEEEIRGCLNEK